MIKIKLCLLLLILSIKIQGQQVIASLKLPNKNELYNSQVLEIGDTIFFSYFETFPSTIQKGIIFYPNGKSESIDLTEITEPISAIDRVGSNFYYYYFYEASKKAPILKTVNLNLSNNTMSSARDTEIEGKIVGLLKHDAIINLISWDKKERKLRVYSIKGDKSTVEDFVLPENTHILDAKDFQIISSNSGWLYEANSWVKIYLESNRIRIALDWFDRIEVMSLKEGKAIDTISISTNNSDFRSFICDSLLFRYHIFNNGLYVKTYDSYTGKELDIYSLERKKISKDRLIYLHAGRQNYTQHNLSIEALFRSSTLNAEPVIVANKIESGKYNLALGTFFNKKGMGGGAGSNIASSIITMIVATGIKQWREQPAVSRYFYCEFANKKIDFNSEPTTIHKLIDDFDSKRSKETSIEDLIVKDLNNAYLVTRDSKSNTLQLIKISKK